MLQAEIVFERRLIVLTLFRLGFFGAPGPGWGGGGGALPLLKSESIDANVMKLGG